MVITLIYDEHGPRSELSVLQHRYDEIQMMIHLHLEKGQCMEVFIARGENHGLREILGRIRKIRGVAGAAVDPAPVEWRASVVPDFLQG